MTETELPLTKSWLSLCVTQLSIPPTIACFLTLISVAVSGSAIHLSKNGDKVQTFKFLVTQLCNRDRNTAIVKDLILTAVKRKIFYRGQMPWKKVPASSLGRSRGNWWPEVQDLSWKPFSPRIKLFGISAVTKRKRDWLIDRDTVTSPVLLFSFVSRLLSCSWLKPKGGCCLFLPKGGCFLFLYLFSVFVRCLVCVYSTLSRPRYAYLLSQTGRVVCDWGRMGDVLLEEGTHPSPLRNSSCPSISLRFNLSLYPGRPLGGWVGWYGCEMPREGRTILWGTH